MSKSAATDQKMEDGTLRTVLAAKRSTCCKAPAGSPTPLKLELPALAVASLKIRESKARDWSGGRLPSHPPRWKMNPKADPQ
jgi:hypothetical protein